MTRPSPLQNRVLPTGDIVASSARGQLMGNRGILHKDYQLGTSRWKHKNWVCCALSFKGRRRELMSPGRYTELFFLDEATALAAGHRPCAECRRAAYQRFRDMWDKALGPVTSIADIDAALHSARVTRKREQVRHQAPMSELPSGCFVLKNNQPHLVGPHVLLPFEQSGYQPPRPREDEDATVLTPRPLVEVLKAGYVPDLHPSAQVS